MTREQLLTCGLNHQTMIGVEVGPWYNPIAPRMRGWNTTIVDFSTTDELVARAKSHTSVGVRKLVHNIEDVDVVWRGQQLSRELLERSPDGFDFIIASHVIEHIPDLLSCLNDLASCLKPTGMICLAVPDRRFCFDFFRPLTLTDEVLLAFREKRMRHSPETLFRAEAYQGWMNGQAAWQARNDKAVMPVGELTKAYSEYSKACKHNEEQPYVDAHAWIFTPSSFELVILELRMLGLLELKLLNINSSTASEFIVQLSPSGGLDFSSPEHVREKLITQMKSEI